MFLVSEGNGVLASSLLIQLLIEAKKMVDDWRNRNLATIRSLTGLEVVSFQARLEPLNWIGDDEQTPLFSHSDLPFEHLAVIEITFTDAQVIRIQSDQGDEGWGLVAEKLEESQLQHYIGDLPIKKFNHLFGSLKVQFIEEKDSMIRLIKLSISNNIIWLMAGEVEPCREGLIIQDMDESVLLFNSEQDLIKTRIGEKLKINLSRL